CAGPGVGVVREEHAPGDLDGIVVATGAVEGDSEVESDVGVAGTLGPHLLEDCGGACKVAISEGAPGLFVEVVGFRGAGSEQQGDERDSGEGQGSGIEGTKALRGG